MARADAFRINALQLRERERTYGPLCPRALLGGNAWHMHLDTGPVLGALVPVAVAGTTPGQYFASGHTGLAFVRAVQVMELESRGWVRLRTVTLGAQERDKVP